MSEETNFKVTTLEEEWRQYRDACYPPHQIRLTALQESETRQAFFAGVLVALKVTTESATLLPEHLAQRNIENMNKEALTVCKQRSYYLKNQN